jgi:hypothetical protein
MDTILEAVLSRLKTRLGGKFSEYELGRRQANPKSKMPLLTIYPISTRNLRSGTGCDDAQYEIGISVYVITAKNAGTGTAGLRNSMSEMELVRMVEGRDSGGKAKEDSLIGVLNSDLTVDGTVLFTDNLSVDYSADFTEDNLLILSASLRFTAETRPLRH